MLNLQTIKKDINGVKYEISYFPARYNMALGLKFANTINISIASFFKFFDEKDNMSVIGEALGKLVASIYHNDPNCEIILEILSQTLRNGVAINKDTFDEFYTGNIEEMLQALYESMKVHFAPFLPIKNLSGNQILQSQKKRASAES